MDGRAAVEHHPLDVGIPRRGRGVPLRLSLEGHARTCWPRQCGCLLLATTTGVREGPKESVVTSPCAGSAPPPAPPRTPQRGRRSTLFHQLLLPSR